MTTILAMNNRCSHVEFPGHDLANAEYRFLDCDRTDPPLLHVLNFTRQIPSVFCAASPVVNGNATEQPEQLKPRDENPVDDSVVPKRAP